MFSSVSINDEVDENYLNKIIKNLYETTFFKDISVKLNNEILLISVVENPLIENIVYKGLKAEKIQSKITTNLKLKSRSSYNEFELKKDKLMMLSNLKELGYNFSTVDVFIKNLNDNKIEIIYDITLGNKAKIKKISFIGNKIFKDNELKRVIISEE
jgi:outer membrane protein insertion porin family